MAHHGPDPTTPLWRAAQVFGLFDMLLGTVMPISLRQRAVGGDP
ncbi:hypothetical protein [Mycobacterium senriense]|nr:hypothetical protein [Mycobacterium senriense]